MVRSEPTTSPILPTLSPGVTRLRMDGQTRLALQSLVLDHLILTDGSAVWVDAKNLASTTTLYSIAPSRRLLDRIAVARAFTAFQHHSLLSALTSQVTPDTAIVVVPAIEWFYDADDLCTGEGKAMLEDGLEQLSSLAEQYAVPILVTSDQSTALTSCVGSYADTELECTLTAFGPRFSSDAFETLVYECQGGVQTTFEYWRQVLAQRQAMPAQEVSTVGAH